MNRSVLMRNQPMDKSVKQKYFVVLKVLETTYIHLSTCSAFLAQFTDETTELYAMAARQLIPFDEWMKTAECRICKKKGHIVPDYLDKNDKPRGSGRYND